MDGERPLFGMFGTLGELFQYPTTDLQQKAEGWIGAADCAPAEARQAVADFARFVEFTPSGRLEEIYSASFDLAPACTLYVGHQLLGEDPKRGALLLMLKQCYREAGLALDGELPDHLSLLLRYLAVSGDAEVEAELIGRLLLPALEKMLPALKDGNGYRSLLQATMVLCRAVSGG
jgi:nitrate reductase molybdenum cofactor assembly chaperone NarJ/NarW